MGVTIGIPRTLSYYSFFPFWQAFFEELGFNVICSESTTKGILDAGVKEAVNDACVPIKVLHGHVSQLVNKANYIFVPRMVNVSGDKTETFCPKFLGLPDMVRSAFPGTRFLSPRVDFRKGTTPLWSLCHKLGREFGKGHMVIIKAFRQAKGRFHAYNLLLEKGYTPPEAMSLLDTKIKKLKKREISTQGNINIALLGFPYALYDPFVSVDIIKKLRELGVNIHTVEKLSSETLQAERKKLPKDMFWYYSNKVVRAALYYLECERIDGIIHVTTFGCGPDAMADKMIELEAKKRAKTPFMSITIDEHTGEAGLLTRLEAFTDMIRLRRKLS